MSNLRKDSPCRYCTDKHIGCHGPCKDYNDWVVALRKEDKGNKALMPYPIYTKSFTGTSPRPGRNRRTRNTHVRTR